METFEVNLNENPLFKESMIDSFLTRNENQREVIPNHPVARMQHEGYKKDEMTKMRKYADLYGTGYAFQLCMERNMLANTGRMYPLKSSNLALNLHCGNYDKMEFKDFLGHDKPFDVDQSLFRQAEKIYME